MSEAIVIECRFGTAVRLLIISLTVGALPLAARAETLQFEFAQGNHSFVAGFADYPVGEETFYELESQLRPLPPNLGQATSLFISGNNHSDDLFMFYKRRISGLVPNTPYRLGFASQFATEAEFGSFGIGGSPAHSVYLKAGASAFEPAGIVQNGDYRLNVDKGQQASPGAAALVLGDVSKPDGAPVGFQLVTRSSGAEFLDATSSPAGDLWLFFGTDSGFEGTTSLYYTNFDVTLEPIPEPTTAGLAAVALLIAVAAPTRQRRRTSNAKGNTAPSRRCTRYGVHSSG
jgi:hypothetical protein